MECTICSEVVPEQHIVLLPCLHAICLKCKQDLLNEKDKPNRCFYPKCNESFVPKDVVFLDNFKKANTRENPQRNWKAVVLGSLTDTRNKIVKNQVIQKYRNANNTIKELMDIAESVLNKQIEYYYTLKARLHSEALEEINGLDKSLAIFSDQLDGIVTRADQISTMLDVNTELPESVLDHIQSQVNTLQNETSELLDYEHNIPKLKLEFTEALPLNVNFMKNYHDKYHFAYPFDSPHPKFALTKKELIGEGWENAAFYWQNPYNLVCFDFNRKRVIAIDPNYAHIKTMYVLLYSWEGNDANFVDRMAIQKDSGYFFFNRKGEVFPEGLRSDINEYQLALVVNNYPFKPIMSPKEKNEILSSSGGIYYLVYDENNILKIYGNYYNRTRNVNMNNLTFYTTPNIPDALIYDSSMYHAYPFNILSQEHAVSLEKYKDERICGVFSCRDRNNLIVFLNQSPYFVRIVNLDGKEEHAFARPVELVDQDIVDVTLINDSSYYVETKTMVFIF